MLYLKGLYSQLIYLVGVITHTRITCLNGKYSGAAACGDRYEAKKINVMLEVAFKRCPEQCFLETPVLKSKWRDQKRERVWLYLLGCDEVRLNTWWHVLFCSRVVPFRPLLQTATTGVQISSKYLVLESGQTHVLQTTHKHTKTKEKKSTTRMFHCDMCLDRIL